MKLVLSSLLIYLVYLNLKLSLELNLNISCTIAFTLDLSQNIRTRTDGMPIVELQNDRIA